MPSTQPRQATVSAYLMKRDKVSPLPIVSGATRLTHKTITLGDGSRCELYVRPMPSRTPKWAKFLDPYVDGDLLGKNQSTGAVLFVPVEQRLFAVTFGQGGRFILDQDCWEERFGLLVVLNSIDQDQIKTIDKSTFDALTTHSKIQTSKEASAQDFGIDIEQDLVRALTGRPKDQTLGQRLTGMDAIKASLKITIEELPILLRRYLEQSRSSIYRSNFPWVDHIAEVKGTSLLDACATIFHKAQDCQAFLSILALAKARHPVKMFAFSLTASVIGIHPAELWHSQRRLRCK